MSDSSSAKLKGLLMLASANTPVPEAPQLIPWRPDFPGIPPPAAVAVLAALDPSQESVVDSIGYHSRQISGVPWVRHAPLPVSALSAHGAVAASSSQTLARKAVSAALPGIVRQNGPVTSLATATNVATQDNVQDGASFGRVKNSELINNGVKQLNDGVNVRTAASAAAAHDAVGNLLLKNVATVNGVTTGPSTTSTTFAVIPEMTQTLTFHGNKIILVFSTSLNLQTVTGTNQLVAIAFFRDGVQVSQEYQMTAGFTGVSTVVTNWEFLIPLTYLDTPSAGSHTYDVRWRLTNTGPTLFQLGTNRTFQIVELG